MDLRPPWAIGRPLNYFHKDDEFCSPGVYVVTKVLRQKFRLPQTRLLESPTGVDLRSLVAGIFAKVKLEVTRK